MLQVSQDCEHIEKLVNTNVYSYRLHLFSKKSVQLKIQKKKKEKKRLPTEQTLEEQTTDHDNSHLLQYV